MTANLKLNFHILGKKANPVTNNGQVMLGIAKTIIGRKFRNTTAKIMARLAIASKLSFIFWTVFHKRTCGRLVRVNDCCMFFFLTNC